MPSNLDRYRAEISDLVHRGKLLTLSMEVECFPELVKRFTKEQKAKIPDFKTEYQTWYSEGLACISQLLPQRLGDFKGYYDEGKPRKEITFANYSIRDYLGGLQVNRVQGLSREPIVGPSAA